MPQSGVLCDNTAGRQCHGTTAQANGGDNPMDGGASVMTGPRGLRAACRGAAGRARARPRPARCTWCSSEALLAAGRGQQEEEAKHVRGRIEWPAPAPGEGVSVDCYWKEGLARKSGVGADRVLCLVSAPPPMRNQATRQGTNLEINNKGDRSRVFPDSQTRYSRLLMINIKTTSRRYYVAPPHARARAWGRARPVGACCPPHAVVRTGVCVLRCLRRPPPTAFA